MRTSQKFDPVFAALYDAEDDENRWSHIAEALSGCLDATTVRVTAVREATGDVLLDALTRDWPKSVLQEYDSYYQDLDPRMQAVTDRIGTTVTCVELPAQEDFDRSEFVADFLDRLDVDARWGMLQIRRSWDGMLLRIGACRRRARGPFLTDEKSEFDAALRHVFHALELDGRLISLKAERDNLAGTLEVDRTPAIILTTDMRAQYMNPAAAKLVGDGKSLRIVAGRLVANQSRDNGLLDRIVKRAAPSDESAGPEIAVLRTAHGGRILARAYALPRSSSYTARTNQCVLLLLTVGSGGVSEGIDAVLDSYGLTQAECRLVKELLHSIETVRSQLKAAHAKLGAHRQAELFRLLARYLR